MSLRFTLLPLRLLGLSCLTLPPAAVAQAPASDGAAPVAADSVRPSTDSASKPDSISASPDSTRPSGSAAATTTDTAATSPEPADSILISACGGPGGAATVARDLLVIVFAPGIGPDERTGAAKTVRGKLLGPVSGEPGAYYLRVPAGGGEFQLRTAADQLIRLSQVRQVGSRACPPPPSPVKTRQTSP
jgi:hypothetical protein